VIFAATKGYLDKVKISDISAFEISLLREVDPAILSTIKDEKAISPATQGKLSSFLDKFTSNFLSTRD
jgi:F-type H+-transporting ATPase subunit alpha